ncbi:MAG: imidazole glycerol phosphate synthase subunit HisH [Planctomycetes bacterium]|nr:imidazole glycerol phosphate synthase subunit HisH [Planctomycetota bacterium]
MGNLASVAKAIRHVGGASTVVSSPGAIESAERLVLPGVGAFGDAVKRLQSARLVDPLLAYLASGRPFLGICLGMQLLLESSEESPGTHGLGLFAGAVRRLRTPLKVPHIGWNTVQPVGGGAGLFEGIPEPCFYFVHSYVMAPADPSIVLGTTDYGEEFPSAIGKGAVRGVQFHPEKSQKAGLRLLESFLRMSGVPTSGR